MSKRAYLMPLVIGAIFLAASALVMTWTSYSGVGSPYLILNWRLPTYLTLLGASVAVAGGTYVLQHLTSNSAVDLGLIGISALDLVIFTLSLVLIPVGQFAQFNALVMPWIYLGINALLCLLLGVLATRRKGMAGRLIIAAALLTMILAALTTFLAQLLPMHQLTHLIANKSQGAISTNLSIFNGAATYIAASLIISALAALIIWWRPLSAVRGEASRASTIGVNVKLARYALMIIASMLATGGFLLIGNLVFIGFVACHLTRQLYRVPRRLQLLMTMLVAASLIFLVHFVNTNWLAWNLPLGVISALAAAPYLLVVWLRRGKGQYVFAS